MYKNEKIFQFFANLILALLTICCVAPYLLMISASFRSESSLSVYGYTFWPKEFDLSAYKYLFSSTGALLKAYSVSIGVTVVGTVLNLIMTILMSYPLSRKDLPGRNIFAFYLFFTMLFNGGLIPSYIMWTRNFHIQNTIWALSVRRQPLQHSGIVNKDYEKYRYDQTDFRVWCQRNGTDSFYISAYGNCISGSFANSDCISVFPEIPGKRNYGWCCEGVRSL